ncbi:MAG TPA: hypothetical protein VF461_16565 [Gemmatimonadaceae bacterium]
MTTRSDPTFTSAVGDRATRAPWLSLIVIVLAQLQMAINISALPVSLGPISRDLHAPATAAATTLLLYSLFVAAFVMLGAKVGKLLGVPTLVVLIAANYNGRQQEAALGEGTMLTLLFNVLVSASPKRLAGDVGALRGVVNNVSNALGAAFTSVVALWLLGVFLTSSFNRSELPPELHAEVLFDDVDFVSNDALSNALGATSATHEQVEEAVAINEAARLRALQASFLIVGAISLLSIFPASRLPRYVPGELSVEEILDESRRGETAAVSPP